MHPLNPLAVLAQRSEQVHIWGGGGGRGEGGEKLLQKHRESKDDSRTQASRTSSSRFRSVIEGTGLQTYSKLSSPPSHPMSVSQHVQIEVNQNDFDPTANKLCT